MLCRFLFAEFLLGMRNFCELCSQAQVCACSRGAGGVGDIITCIMG